MFNSKTLEGKMIEILVKIYCFDKNVGIVDELLPHTILLILSHYNNTIIAQVISERKKYHYSSSNHQRFTPGGVVQIIDFDLTTCRLLRTDTNRAQDPNVLL